MTSVLYCLITDNVTENNISYIFRLLNCLLNSTQATPHSYEAGTNNYFNRSTVSCELSIIILCVIHNDIYNDIANVR